MKQPALRSLLLTGLFIFAGLGILAGCGLFGDAEQSTADQASGLWKAVSGDLEVSAGHGIYFYNCYLFERGMSDLVVTVWWDNGARWITTPAVVKGRQIELEVHGVEAAYTIHSEESATATFVDNDSTFTKELVKIRESVSPQENLYSACS